MKYFDPKNCSYDYLHGLVNGTCDRVLPSDRTLEEDAIAAKTELLRRYKGKVLGCVHDPPHFTWEDCPPFNLNGPYIPSLRLCAICGEGAVMSAFGTFMLRLPENPLLCLSCYDNLTPGLGGQ